MATRRSPAVRLLRAFVVAVFAAIALSILLVAAGRVLDPWTSSVMLHERLSASGPDAAPLRFDWVPMTAISPHVALAVVAAEDQRFPVHAGFDVEAIRKALRTNADGGRVRGASTISQQVAKNLYLWSGRSWLRKGLEAWFTVLIEALWPKARILEVYLNLAEFGPNTYGVEAASQAYFRKSADRLTSREAATLAAVLPSPRRLHADRPTAYVARRRDWILGQMRRLGGTRYLEPVLQPGQRAGS